MSQNNPTILGRAPLGKLLFQYSLPAIIGMTLTSLYNIIDSIFIGHGVGAMAISGLAITFPFMNLVAAFGVLISAGGSTISSIRLGQRDSNGATKVLNNTLMLCFTNSIVFGGISLLFIDEILVYFGASPQTLPYARDFMKVILMGTPISYTMIALNNIMRATGYPKKAMLTSMVTIVCNVILAPIFIFKFHWGIEGAAFATVISQFIGMCWVVNHFRNPKSYIHFKAPVFKMELPIIKNIFSIGMAPFLMNVCACVIVIFINNRLQNNGGDLAIGAYGIINRLITLYVMIVVGLTMGMQPIIGYNFGALKFNRVKKTLNLGLIVATAITTSGFLICEFFPHGIAAMFTHETILIDMAADGLRIAIAMFPIIGLQIVITNFFQSIGMAKISVFLSLSRQLLFLLPGLIFFPRYWGIKGVWLSMPFSDFFATVTAVGILLYLIRKIKEPDILEDK